MFEKKQRLKVEPHHLRKNDLEILFPVGPPSDECAAADRSLIRSAAGQVPVLMKSIFSSWQRAASLPKKNSC